MDVARRDSGVELPVTGLDLVAQPALGLDLVAVDDAERRVLVEVEPARACLFLCDRLMSDLLALGRARRRCPCSWR